MTNNKKIHHPRINALKKNAKKSTNTKHPKRKGGKKTKRRRTKRRLRKSSKVNRRRRRKTRKTKRRRRRRRQRGGGGCGCQNPFVGKSASALGNGNYNPSEPVGRLPYSMLTKQPNAVNMRGGGLWQDLGLTLPKEMYYDGMSYLKNIKNTWVGDKHISTSNVLKQPIANTKTPTMHPVDYFDEFRKADASVADQLDFTENVVN